MISTLANPQSQSFLVRWTDSGPTRRPSCRLEADWRQHPAHRRFSLAHLRPWLNRLDRQTAEHSQRVLQLAVRFGIELGLTEWELHELATGALLHDVGKSRIAADLLNKTTPLTPAEMDIIKCHPEHGVALLDDGVDLACALPTIRHHHEQWDGNGYPDRLAGADIPLFARMVALADVFDAMTSDRPYRAGLPVSAVCRHLEAKAGEHFDPLLTRVFLARIVAFGAGT